MTVEIIPELQPFEAIVSPPTRILIVDDEPDLSLALSVHLQRQGYETMSVGTGAEALREAKIFLPHLVLLDLGLPDMSGLKVCEHLADDEATCGTPVLIISGSEAQDIVRQCRAAGSEFFIRKPYDPNVVLTLIERSLTRDW